MLQKAFDFHLAMSPKYLPAHQPLLAILSIKHNTKNKNDKSKQMTLQI